MDRVALLAVFCALSVLIDFACIDRAFQSGDTVPRDCQKTPVWRTDLIQLVPLKNLKWQLSSYLQKLSWFRLHFDPSCSISFMAAGAGVDSGGGMSLAKF